MRYDALSGEQRQFVDLACRGCNVLVDACIGSGKTTAIQVLCSMPAMSNKSVLYLTYNRLLRIDAKSKIHQANVRVTNYHAFAYGELRYGGYHPNVTSCIREYLDSDITPLAYDVLVIDEYQDIEQELAELLEKIRFSNPGMQVVAVGDMCQKIYDKTRLDARAFITHFLGGEGRFARVEFTRCFRLGSEMAGRLANIWEKDITGVNQTQDIRHMTLEETETFLSLRSPGDILVLGSANGFRNMIQNHLEALFPDKFNKYTVWSKIREGDGGATEPSPETAVFTTYDGCKGMERPVCVITDWTEDYWYMRSRQEMVKYEILRNIFCVAASRGKETIIFVEGGGGVPLEDRTLCVPFQRKPAWKSMAMSEMFDFKFIEDVHETYRALDVHEIQPPGRIIDVQNHDALIDLSPCLGTYIEAAYFDGCDIDTYIEEYFDNHPDDVMRLKKGYSNWPLPAKVLYLTALNTKQERYMTQVLASLIAPERWVGLPERLAEHLPADCDVQVPCLLAFGNPDGSFLFAAKGRLDAMADGFIYELKFVSALQPQHFLQLAMYMCAQNVPVGRLWNVRDNQLYEVRIPDRDRFLSLVLNTVTKGLHTVYVPFDENRVMGVGLALKDRLELTGESEPSSAGAAASSDKPAERSMRTDILTEQVSARMAKLKPAVPADSPSGDRPAPPVVRSGMRFVHDKFGFGTVLSVAGSERDMVVELDFGDKGVKKLLLAVAAEHMRPVNLPVKKRVLKSKSKRRGAGKLARVHENERGRP